MKKKIGKSFVVVGQNITTLSMAGMMFTDDKISAINAFVALTISLVILLAGHILNNGKE